jgi:hypothetical protein
MICQFTGASKAAFLTWHSDQTWVNFYRYQNLRGKIVMSVVEMSINAMSMSVPAILVQMVELALLMDPPLCNLYIIIIRVWTGLTKER